MNGIPIKGRVNNGKGEYLQTTHADDDPAKTLDPAIIDPAVSAAYSPEDIAEAHRHAIRFIAEEGIDSTINGGVDPVDPKVNIGDNVGTSDNSEKGGR